MVTLHTARLTLRPPREDDVAAFFAIFGDKATMAHWSTLPHEDPDVTREWLGRMRANAGTGHEFVIEYEGRAIGKAGSHTLPEVGYILHRDHWGKGFVTEAMQAILPHIWATSDVPELFGDVDPLNPASVRVLEKLGFRESGRAERTYNIGGVWSDSVYLTLARPTPSA